MSEKAIINPEVLKWARLTAKMTLVEVSLKITCRVEKLEAWEKGNEYPTIRQAEKLSQIYRRPLAVFFLPIPPKDFQTLRDFRRIDAFGEYSTALTFIIRDIQERQSWIREFLIEQSDEPLSFLGKFTLNNSPQEVADNIKKELEIESRIDAENVLKYWIDKVESKRIFISLASNVHNKLKLSVEEVRGFAICDKFTPFIFINSADTKNGQLFTIAHELAHIWINQTGVSNIEFREYNLEKYDPVEVFCNEVAAEVLLPYKIVKEYFKNIRDINLERIDLFANVMKVSAYFVSVRLLKLEMLSKEEFNKLKKIFSNRYALYLIREENRKKNAKGGPNFYLLQIRKNSKAFTYLIYDNYKGGFITGNEASALLKIKVNHFDKLENYLLT